MKIKLSYMVIGLLVIILVVSNLWNRGKVKTITEYKTDTLIFNKIDTNNIINPYISQIRQLEDSLSAKIKIKYIKKDSIVYKDSIIYLPKEQKYYFKENVYDCWISGYNPVLDSIKVFNKIEYKTITNTVTNTVYKERWNWYLETGINSISNNIAPYIGMRLTMPNNFGMGANIGVFDNKAFYGFSINYKIK